LEGDVLDALIYKVVGCAIEVHRSLGPGFLESVYRRSMEIELAHRKIAFEAEKPIRLQYRGKPVGVHKLDLFVEGLLVVELKTVDEFCAKHYAQVRSYLKAVNQTIGLLANFADYQVNCRRVELKQPNTQP
jgi:GxxExxY protein